MKEKREDSSFVVLRVWKQCTLKYTQAICKFSKFLLCNHLLAGTTGGERIADFGPRELLLASMSDYQIMHHPRAENE